MKQIKYWYWRKYKNIPHTKDVMETWQKALPISADDLKTYEGAKIAMYYAYGLSIKFLSEDNKYTRERIKQLIWKYYNKWSNTNEQ